MMIKIGCAESDLVDSLSDNMSDFMFFFVFFLGRLVFFWSPLGVVPIIFGPPDRWIPLVSAVSTFIYVYIYVYTYISML